MYFTSDKISGFKYLGDLAKSLNEIYAYLKVKNLDFYVIKNNINSLDDLFRNFYNSVNSFELIYSRCDIEETVGYIKDSQYSLSVHIMEELNRYKKEHISEEIFVRIIISSIYDFFDRVIKKHDYKNENIPALELEKFRMSLDLLSYLKDEELVWDRETKEKQKNISEKIIILEDKINNLVNQGILNSEIFERRVSDFLIHQKVDYDERARKTMEDFRDNVGNYEIEIKQNMIAKINDLKVDYNHNKNELATLLGDLELYKSMIFQKTENEISKHYSTKATEEKITYWSATLVSILIIMGSIGLAWYGLDAYYRNYVSVSQCLEIRDYKDCIEKLELIRNASKDYAFYYLIMRLIFSILLFLTVIYTSRIAIRAYSHWRHSENMHLKLASLRPFISRLGPDEQSQIHKDLVPDYFGKDAGIVDGQNEKFKDLPANVSAVAMKAIEQIGGAGRSSEGKNDKKEEA